MDNRINYRLVLDTETANTIDQPLVYDIGGIVTDKQGRKAWTNPIFLKEDMFHRF